MAMKRVEEMANAAIDRHLRAEALRSLWFRVEDWKGQLVHDFGGLIMFGNVLIRQGDLHKIVSATFV